MKKLIYIFVVALFIACGSDKTGTNIEEVLVSDDIAKIKEVKKQLQIEKTQLLAKISKLDAKLLILEPSSKLPLVTVKKLVIENFNHYLEFQGSVKTKKNIVIYPQASGQLQSVFVRKGSLVKKGQVLARIDDNGLVNQLTQLQIQADLAKTTFERQSNLWNQKIGSEIQYLQAKANYEARRSGVKQMQANIARYTVKAPFTGVIDDVFKESGALVAPGRGGEIFRILNLNNMFLEADIPESYLSKIKKGKEVLVNFTVLNKEVTSIVREVGSYINPMNRSFKVEVKAPSLKGMVKPNMTAKLKINDYKNTKAILISQSIISENSNGEQYVYIVEGKNKNKGKVTKRVIVTGVSKDGIVEVTKGLVVGDEVVLEGARAIKEGQDVIVLTK